MTTATLKEAAEKLGVSLDDLVHYQARGNRAIIEIDLKMPAFDNGDHLESPQPQGTLTPDEEFRRKYPDIKITRPQLFKLVGSMADVPPHVSDQRLSWAQRKPTLVFRLAGLFLLRQAQRRVCGLLFHAPPCNTRCSEPAPARGL